MGSVNITFNKSTKTKKWSDDVSKSED